MDSLEFLKAVKAKLLSLRIQILSRAHHMHNIPDEERADVFDMTSVEKMRDVEHIASSIDVETLKLVERALEKIEFGNYGTCEFCGAEIDRERLLEIPYVRYCVDCQEKLEVEEHVHKLDSELGELEKSTGGAIYDNGISGSEQEDEEEEEEKIVKEKGAVKFYSPGEGERDEVSETVEEEEEIEEATAEEELMDEDIEEEVEEEIEEELKKDEMYYAEGTEEEEEEREITKGLKKKERPEKVVTEKSEEKKKKTKKVAKKRKSKREKTQPKKKRKKNEKNKQRQQ